jgi:hypothetical protein
LLLSILLYAGFLFLLSQTKPEKENDVSFLTWNGYFAEAEKLIKEG